MHLGSLESAQEARVAELLRLVPTCAISTSISISIRIIMWEPA